MIRLALLLCVLIAPVAEAQTLAAQLANATAITFCTPSGPRTMVDASVLGTDSTQEILVHEAKHRDQYRTRGCADDSPDAALADEAEAFCVSLPFAAVPRAQCEGEYLGKMYRMFGGHFSLAHIATVWRERCPR